MVTATMELPPRARRIQPTPTHQMTLQGTTSACAENTFTMVSSAPLNGNYLRVRGEYFHDCEFGAPEWELPPRARRIRLGQA